MDTHMTPTDDLSRRSNPGLSRNAKLALISASVIATFFILREHWEHALGLLPYLLLISCPLMHLLGHGHHHRHGEDNDDHAHQAR
jgi:hypothetical protein